MWVRICNRCHQVAKRRCENCPYAERKIHLKILMKFELLLLQSFPFSNTIFLRRSRNQSMHLQDCLLWNCYRSIIVSGLYLYITFKHIKKTCKCEREKGRLQKLSHCQRLRYSKNLELTCKQTSLCNSSSSLLK